MAAELEMRVLVLAPTGRDALNASAILAKAQLPCVVCRSVDELCAEIDRGAGAVLVTEEAFFAPGGRERLERSLGRQPGWSDLPFVALTTGGPDSPAGQHAMETLGNVILLERPVRITTCVTAMRTALRMRRRQYLARQHLDELHQAEERKNEFLAMLAHELRNPLAPIGNASQLLAAGASAPADLSFISEVIERQLGNLTRLVDDLLDVSRITRGKITLVRESLALARAVAGAVEISRPAMQQRRHRFTLQAPDEDCYVDGDLTRLTQVIANLLNNAAKFTPDGGEISLSVQREAGRVRLCVRDNGAGIEPELLPRVFDMFVQGESSLHRSHGGLGIGLTLVRKLVEMHGGEVRAHSAGLGRGAEFQVSLPCCPPPAASAAASAQARSSGRRLLIVDDNVDAARSLSMLLQAAGHEVRLAYDGHSALGLAQQWQPQFCVLDIGLPLMDGYELAGRIRASAESAPCLIALSGYGEARSRERGRKAGFDHYMVKPLQFERLLAIIGGAPAAPADSGEPPPPELLRAQAGRMPAGSQRC